MYITAENKAARRIPPVPLRQTQPLLLWLPPSSLLQAGGGWIFSSLHACGKSNTRCLHHGKQDNGSLSTKSINPAWAQLSRGFVSATQGVVWDPASGSWSLWLFQALSKTRHSESEESAHITMGLSPVQRCTWTTLRDPQLWRERRLLWPVPFYMLRESPVLSSSLQSWMRKLDSDLQAKKGTN